MTPLATTAPFHKSPLQLATAKAPSHAARGPTAARPSPCTQQHTYNSRSYLPTILSKPTTGCAHARVPSGHSSARLQPTSALPPPAAEAKPLFTSLSMPVYSLSTRGADSEVSTATMNLVTYAAPVSIKPQRFALGLYLGTLSHENFKSTGRGVLQVLSQQHAPLFQVLGKTSGRGVDKLRLISDAGFQLVSRYGYQTLADAACVMELQAASEFIPCGDHEVVICDILSYENAALPLDLAVSSVLYTSELRKLGYMAA